MDYRSELNNKEDFEFNVKEEIYRYLSFWPYLLITLVAFTLISFAYLRYTPSQYISTAVIEILDESQDREMALPTELTVFNRSMINLENETNVLKSFLLHSKVVRNLNSNIFYYRLGQIKSSEMTKVDWFDDYEIEYNIDLNETKVTLIFNIEIVDGKLIIDDISSPENIISYKFDGLKTNTIDHNLPFDLYIKKYDEEIKSYQLKILPVSKAANFYKKSFQTQVLGDDSDQLLLKLVHENPQISEKYLMGILSAFDNDGILDRQLEYKRTIEFVNQREKILKNELEVIEIKKQDFKKLNNLSDIKVDASNNIDSKLVYDSELFDAESQKTLALFLKETLSDGNYDYLPINIGLENFDLNNIISQYNNSVTKRNSYLIEAGSNNILVKTLESQLDDLVNNISKSLDGYLSTIDLKIKNLKDKESEFDNIYNTVPENEKILRSIERELSIKEALYLLLLQKREEAAINFAVVKPTIKIIEYPITENIPLSPRPQRTYLAALILSFTIFFIVLFIWFYIDDKIHHKDQLMKKLNKAIPILSEIPFIKDLSESKIFNSNDTRTPLTESIRMLIANLRFTFMDLNLDSQIC